jgi:alpha-tubulin suppressor-like RCC1 family protein
MSPRVVEALDGAFVTDAATRGSHVLALTADGRLYTWGRADEGQLGHGQRNEKENYQVPRIVARLKELRVTSISAGRMHSIVVTDESQVFAWGCGDDGALGMGDTTSSTIPQRIASLDGKMITKVSCGSRHTLALTAKGLVFCWGWNSYGQLGLGDTNNRVTPTVISSLASMRVSEVCSGYRHSFVVVSNQRREVGSLWGWGWNQYGQVGLKKDNSMSSFSLSTSVLSPVKIMDSVQVWSIAAGGRHTIASLSNHVSKTGWKKSGSKWKPNTAAFRVYAWGRGDDGQLGIGTTSMSCNPQPMTSLLPDQGQLGKISCGWAHSCAVVPISNLAGFEKGAYMDETPGGPTLSTFCIRCVRMIRGSVVVGDIDGFVGQLLNGLLQFMTMFNLCSLQCGFSNRMIASTLIPGAAVAFLLGALFFTFQALQLKLTTGAKDVTALPHGLNTITLFAYILLVMKPEFELTGDPVQAWHAGLAASFYTAAFEIVVIFMVKPIQRLIPRAALLSSVAGVSLTFLSMEFLLQIYGDPGAGILSLMASRFPCSSLLCISSCFKIDAKSF